MSRVDCVTLSGNLLLLRLWLRALRLPQSKTYCVAGRRREFFVFCFIRLTAPTIISDTLVTGMAEGAG